MSKHLNAGGTSPEIRRVPPSRRGECRGVTSQRRLLISCLISFIAGAIAPVAFASSHCNTYWSNGKHYHEGSDINNDCSTNGHADDTVEVFWGWGGDDRLDGGAGIDEIRGHGGGQDFLYGGYGSYDVLEGGSGVVGDYIYGGNDPDSIYGGEDRDRIRGDEGNDYIVDSCCGSISEKDHVCGNAGHDDIDVKDNDAEDVVYDPGGSDSISRDNDISEGGVGRDDITTNDCPF